MLKLWKMLWALFMDQRGEDPAAGGDPNAGDPNAGDPNAGDPNADPNIDPATGKPRIGGDPLVTPKFGEFGDDPSEAAVKLFEAFTKQKGEFESFKTKSGLTERNLGTLRQTLEASGIRAVQDENGQIRLEVAKPAGKKVRFTDQHKALWDEKVLESVRLLIQDVFEEQYEGRERTTQEKRQQMQQFMTEKAEVEELMLGYFPQLDPKDPNFNQAFFDRATAIWQEQYKGNLLKQLSAALRAAQELKIIPQMIAAAKKEGVKIGKDGKKVLGPVGSASGPAGDGAMRVLSQTEYLALPQDKREAYDKWRLDHPDAK